MIRKLLMVAAAATVPLGAIAVGLTGTGVAGASAPVMYPNIQCALSGTVQFPAPGLSYKGSISSTKTSLTNATGITYSSCTGGPRTTGGGPFTLAITTKDTKCPKTATNAAPTWSCAKPNYQYDTTSGFSNPTTLTDVKKAVKKLGLSVDGIFFKDKPSSATQVAGSPCPAGEVGFQIQGSVKSKSPKTDYTTGNELACLGNDSGPGTTGNFFNDYVAASSGNTAITIATATIDPAGSYIQVNNP